MLTSRDLEWPLVELNTWKMLLDGFVAAGHKSIIHLAVIIHLDGQDSNTKRCKVWCQFWAWPLLWPQSLCTSSDFWNFLLSCPTHFYLYHASCRPLQHLVSNHYTCAFYSLSLTSDLENWPEIRNLGVLEQSRTGLSFGTVFVLVSPLFTELDVGT